MELIGLKTAQALLTRFQQIQNKLLGFSRLHQNAGTTLRGWVDDNFQAEGALLDNNSAGWPPLKRSTLQKRRGNGRGTKPLQATGRLRNSITVRSDKQSARVFSVVPYAAVHQLGLGVPKRPFLPTATQARRIVDPVLEHHIREALG